MLATPNSLIAPITDTRAFSPQLLRMISKTVHPAQGLIAGLFEQAPNPIAAGIHVTQAVIVPPTYFRSNSPARTQTVDAGTGAGFSRETACWAAIGEGIERYAASIFFADQITWAKASDLPADAIDLTPLIQAGRTGLGRYDARLERGWMLGWDLAKRREIYVPAAITVLGYEARAPYEILGQYVSTGLACGQTFDDAVLRGLCESIERDAFASYWLLGRAPPQLLVDSTVRQHFSPPLLKALDSGHLKISLHLLAVSFGVTVVLGVGQHKELGYGVVGAAASLSPLRATEKAIVEVLHGWTAASAMAGREPINDPAQFKEPSDHVAYYNHAERWSMVAATLDSTEQVLLSSLLESSAYRADNRADLDHVVGRMQCEGFAPVAIDLTSADVGSLGLSVARVVVPGLQPLVFGPDCANAPDQRRLDQWRERWNLPPGSAITGHPHPFP